jgi:hypothetical protein
MSALPPTLVWAWEHPQDLGFLDPNREGVAFLAATIGIDGDRVRWTGRRQPPRFPRGTSLVAVARIEALPRGTSRSSDSGRREVAERIAALSKIRGVRAVQVDFDASFSQRPFYRALLKDIRRALPDSVGLSMTALASWCFGDRWLRGLPVDEVVPMLFRMGADEVPIRSLLSASGDFDCASCRVAVGISADDWLWRPPSGRRICLFSSGELERIRDAPHPRAARRGRRSWPLTGAGYPPGIERSASPGSSAFPRSSCAFPCRANPRKTKYWYR